MPSSLGLPASTRLALALAVASILALGGLPSAGTAVRADARAHAADGANDSLAGVSPTGWSDPSVLARCVLASAPLIAFPSNSPSTLTGAGAVVWASDPSPCGSSAVPPARAAWGLSVAAIGLTDRAKLTSTRSLGGWLGAGLVAVGASFGRVAVAAAVHPPGSNAGEEIAVAQGRATQPLASPTSLPAPDPPFALTRAYLGDVAIATVVAGPAIAVRVQRYFRPDFARARSIPIGAGPVTALTATITGLGISRIVRCSASTSNRPFAEGP